MSREEVLFPPVQSSGGNRGSNARFRFLCRASARRESELDELPPQALAAAWSLAARGFSEAVVGTDDQPGRLPDQRLGSAARRRADPPCKRVRSRRAFGCRLPAIPAVHASGRCLGGQTPTASDHGDRGRWPLPRARLNSSSGVRRGSDAVAALRRWLRDRNADSVLRSRVSVLLTIARRAGRTGRRQRQAGDNPLLGTDRRTGPGRRARPRSNCASTRSWWMPPASSGRQSSSLRFVARKSRQSEAPFRRRCGAN